MKWQPSAVLLCCAVILLSSAALWETKMQHCSYVWCLHAASVDLLHSVFLFTYERHAVGAWVGSMKVHNSEYFSFLKETRRQLKPSTPTLSLLIASCLYLAVSWLVFSTWNISQCSYAFTRWLLQEEPIINIHNHSIEWSNQAFSLFLLWLMWPQPSVWWNLLNEHSHTLECHTSKLIKRCVEAIPVSTCVHLPWLRCWAAFGSKATVWRWGGGGEKHAIWNTFIPQSSVSS